MILLKIGWDTNDCILRKGISPGSYLDTHMNLAAFIMRRSRAMFGDVNVAYCAWTKSVTWLALYPQDTHAYRVSIRKRMKPQRCGCIQLKAKRDST